jgi:hypothetical protein
MAKNQPLLAEGSASALERVISQGEKIVPVLHKEIMEAHDHVSSAYYALAEAIENPATPAQKVQELELEYEHAQEVRDRTMRLFAEVSEFTLRASLVRRQRLDEGED